MRDFFGFGRYPKKGRALRYIFLNVMARTKDEAICQFLVQNKVWLHSSLKRIEFTLSEVEGF